MSEKLNALIGQLKEIRAKKLAASNSYREINEHFQEQLKSDPDYIRASDAIGRATLEEEKLSEAIRQESLSLYSVDGDKKPHDAVQVKIFQVVSIPDENAAREWCFTNFRPALKLDAKTFEKAAKDGTVPEGLAVVTEEPRAQIAAKLE